MSETAFPHDGECPRCGSGDIERAVVYGTTARVVLGVVLSCRTCGLTSRTVSSDREAWYDLHRAWRSPAIPADESFEAFAARWPKKVGQRTYGDAEPLVPVLPVVGRP